MLKHSRNKVTTVTLLSIFLHTVFVQVLPLLRIDGAKLSEVLRIFNNYISIYFIYIVALGQHLFELAALLNCRTSDGCQAHERISL